MRLENVKAKNSLQSRNKIKLINSEGGQNLRISIRIGKKKERVNIKINLSIQGFRVTINRGDKINFLIQESSRPVY